MFTINIYLRFGLIAVFLIGGVALASAYGFWYSFPLLLIGIALVVGYIMLGTLTSTAKLFQEARLAEAEKRLSLTLKPGWLYKPLRANYYMIQGAFASYKKDYDEAEVQFKKAEEIGFTTDNESAGLQLQLANLAYMKKNAALASRHLKLAKAYKVTEPQMKEQLAQLELGVKQMGLSRNPGNRGMLRQPGGKRRRPKMR